MLLLLQDLKREPARQAFFRVSDLPCCIGIRLCNLVGRLDPGPVYLLIYQSGSRVGCCCVSSHLKPFRSPTSALNLLATNFYMWSTCIRSTRSASRSRLRGYVYVHFGSYMLQDTAASVVYPKRSTTAYLNLQLALECTKPLEYGGPTLSANLRSGCRSPGTREPNSICLAIRLAAFPWSVGFDSRCKSQIHMG